MRILDLKLLAYGSFEGKTLDFSHPPGALHVVYGPNEAGKSTALRAVEALLFGFEHAPRDAHLHPADKLRVGGRLEAGSGRVLDVVRRKKQKASLRDAADAIVDEAELRAMLHGVDRSLFRALYGLDHLRLREGARALLDARGGLGESLFEAGLAGAGVAKLSQSLRSEAESLWSPTARKRPLAEALRSFAQARIDERRFATPASAYQLQEEAIAAALAERDEADAAYKEHCVEERRLERAVALVPRLRSRREAVRQREALGTVMLLPEGARAEREAATAARAEASLKLEHAQARVAELRRSLAHHLPQPRAVDDRAVVAAIRDRDAAEVAVAAARGALAAQKARVAQIEDARSRIEPFVTTIPELERLVEAAARVEARGSEAAEAVRRAVEGREALVVARSRLRGLGSGEVAMLGDSLPSEGEVEAWSREVEASRAAATRLASDRARVEARIADLERERAVLFASGDIPTEAGLRSARASRDEALSRARETRDQGAFDAVRGEVRAADEMADRLRREVERAAKLASLEAELGEARRRHVEVGSELEAEEARVVATGRACVSRFESAGVSPPPALELAGDWLQSWYAYVAELAAVRAADELASAFEADAARAASALAAVTNAPAAGPLPSAIARARTEVEARREAARARADADRSLHESLAEVARLSGEVARAETVREQAVARAHALLGPMGLTGEVPLEIVTARALLARDLEEQEARARECADRIASADATLAALAARASVAPEALPEAERRSAGAADLDRVIRGHEETIGALSDGASISDLEAELTSIDLDEATARLADIEDQKASAERRREAATQEMLRKRLGLAEFEESYAFTHALSAEEHLARAKPLLERYVRLRLAATILDRQIASYSQAHQGPVLARAAELFTRLTEGSFSGLKVVLGDGDRAELVATRRADEVEIEGLSDGSRDQLYLALRLATIERHAERAEALPLVLDDVLVHFDDARSRAALAVLAETARRVQVLLFTHHARVVELARAAVPARELGIVELT